MHISFARKENLAAMKYYQARMASLEKAFPAVYPFQVTLETEFFCDSYPVTYVTLTRFRQIEKIWVLVVDGTGIGKGEPANPKVNYVDLSAIYSWRQVKGHILDGIHTCITDTLEEAVG